MASLLVSDADIDPMGRTTYARPAAPRREPVPPIPLEGPVAGLHAHGPAGAGPRPNRRRERGHRTSTLELDHRLSTLVASLRWAAISLGLLTVAIKDPPRPLFLLAGLALATFGVAQTLRPVRLDPPGRALHVCGPLRGRARRLRRRDDGRVHEPVRPRERGPGRAHRIRRRAAPHGGRRLLRLHHDHGARPPPDERPAGAAVGRPRSASSSCSAASSVRSPAGWSTSSVCTRKPRADQVARLTTANELLVALHGVAQSLPASLDLHEVVESSRTRLRSLFQFGVARAARPRRHARRVDRRARRRRAPPPTAP